MKLINYKLVFRKQTLFSAFLVGILLLNAFSVCCQVKKDTLFLYRRISTDDYQAVFIDNKRSQLYNEIVRNITIDSFNYNSAIQSLKDSTNGIVNSFKLNMPTEWCSLHQYEKKYYAYLPSEPYFNTYIRLNDSTLILNYFNDGCVPALLQKAAWVDKKTLQIQTKGLYAEDSIVVFHFLNDSKTMAVIEFPKREDKKRFQLMIAKKSLNEFPLIVNYCPKRRCSEWHFETPNFKTLLQ